MKLVKNIKTLICIAILAAIMGFLVGIYINKKTIISQEKKITELSGVVVQTQQLSGWVAELKKSNHFLNEKNTILSNKISSLVVSKQRKIDGTKVVRFMQYGEIMTGYVSYYTIDECNNKEGRYYIKTQDRSQEYYACEGEFFYNKNSLINHIANK